MGAKGIYIYNDILINEAIILGNEIAFPTKYLDKVNDVFHCRYKLFKDFYCHSINIGIELMIEEVLNLINKKRELNNKKTFNAICQNIQANPMDYANLSDFLLE